MAVPPPANERTASFPGEAPFVCDNLHKGNLRSRLRCEDCVHLCKF